MMLMLPNFVADLVLHITGYACVLCFAAYYLSEGPILHVG